MLRYWYIKGSQNAERNIGRARSEWECLCLGQDLKQNKTEIRKESEGGGEQEMISGRRGCYLSGVSGCLGHHSMGWLSGLRWEDDFIMQIEALQSLAQSGADK